MLALAAAGGLALAKMFAPALIAMAGGAIATWIDRNRAGKNGEVVEKTLAVIRFLASLAAGASAQTTGDASPEAKRADALDRFYKMVPPQQIEVLSKRLGVDAAAFKELLKNCLEAFFTAGIPAAPSTPSTPVVAPGAPEGLPPFGGMTAAEKGAVL